MNGGMNERTNKRTNELIQQAEHETEHRAEQNLLNAVTENSLLNTALQFCIFLMLLYEIN